MVAEFRLEKPNMSYVNVSAIGGSSNSNIVLPVPDEEMNDLSSERSSIRGNILRGNDSNLLPDLLGSMPELRSVVMGGPSVSHDQQQSSYDQQQYFDLDNSFRQSSSSQTFSSQPSQEQQAGAYHNNNLQHRDGSHSFSHLADSPSSGYGSNTTNDGSSAASSSSFSNSSNNQPRLRVANLPRASTPFGGFQHNFNSNGNPDMSRGYSQMEGQSYATPGHASNNHNDGLGFDGEPRVTIIRTTSTIQYANGSSTQTHPFNNFGNNDFNTNGGPVFSHSPAAMSYHQSQQSVLMSANQPQAEISGHGAGCVNRRAQRQAKHRATVNAAAGPTPGDPNTVRVVKDLLKSQETLVKENADLKRKLHLLVSTFNDEQKLNKVLKCLEEKRKAAQSVATS